MGYDELEPEVGGEVLSPRPVRSWLAALLDDLAGKLTLGWSRLGRQMRGFGQRVEGAVFPAAPPGRRICLVEFACGQEGRTVCIDGVTTSVELGPMDRLGEFLQSVGVRSIALETDLESNQVYDVLRTLWSVRRPLRGAEPSWWDRLLGRPAVLRALTSPEGFHKFCAATRLEREADHLEVRNSYCPLTFSRAVSGYMERVSRFRDHRAFFHAAPRFALLTALAVLVPTAVAWSTGGVSHLALGLGVAVALIMGAGALVVFETIGAVQYDKEHQAKVIQERHQALVRAYESIHTDLARARRIQQALIPGQQVQPFPDDVYIAHAFAPEMAVGGDYYDIQRVGDDRVAIVFADVAGHGMGGAFVTGIIKTTFELAGDLEGSVSEFMALLNRTLERMTPPESFAAVIFAVYDVPNHGLHYCSAGHNPPPMVVRRAEAGVERLEEAASVVAGIQPDAAFAEEAVELAPGDRFVLCTDGITESANARGELFGEERLRALLAETAQRPALVVPDRILQEVARHAGETPQADDRTIVVMEVLR